MREWTKRTPGARIRIIAGPHFGKLAVTRRIAGTQEGDKVRMFIEAIIPSTGEVFNVGLSEAVLAMDDPRVVRFEVQATWKNIGLQQWDD